MTARILYLVVCAAPPAQAIGELVELLQARGWAVWVIATPRATDWIDSAAVAELTGQPVRDEYRGPDDLEPLPRADAIAVAPATFNTVNKWVAGISDTFALGLLNEAIGLRLPIVVAPYAKSTSGRAPGLRTEPADAQRVGRDGAAERGHPCGTAQGRLRLAGRWSMRVYGV